MPIIDYDQAGIISPTPESNPNAATVVAKPTITEPSYKDVALDTKWTPVSSIVSHIAGSRWVVNYFRQVIDTDSQLMGQATSVSGVYQQYELIEELNLRVITPLTQVQDPDTKMMQSDGAALVYGNLIPNEGDMFTADIGVGQLAIFRVSNSKKNSVFKEATYEIEYALSTVNEHHIEDLESKVVNKYVWREDFLTRGQNPVVLEEESVALNKLGVAYHDLCEHYFPSFFSDEYKTFLVPLQDYSTYDPFLAKFISDSFDNTDHPVLQQLRVLNLGSDKACLQTNFWTAVSSQEMKKLKGGFKQIGFVWTSQFENNPMFNGIRWTGIKQCVYPLDPRLGINGLTAENVLLTNSDGYDGLTPITFYATGTNPDITGLEASQNKMFPPKNTAALFTNKNPDGTVSFPGVGQDSYYVLGANFYDQTATQSVFEQMVTAYLKRIDIEPEQLTHAAELAPEWGALEQFYYIPLLLVMMRSVINNYQG